MSETERFVQLLWGDHNTDVFTLWRPPAARETCSAHIPLNNRSVIAETASAWAAKATNVYYGFASREHGLSSYVQGKTTQLVYLPGVFLDIDVQAPSGVHAATTTLPPDLAAAESILKLFPLPYTALVHTGYGVHAYWLFDAPLADLSYGERLLKAFQRRVIEEAKKHLGFYVDQTSSLTRVLRLPGTSNYKLPADPQPVLLLSDDGPRYRPSSLESLSLSSRKPGRPSASQVPFVPSTAVNVVVKDGVASVSHVEKPEWWDDVKKLALGVQNEETRELLRKVYAGESFAEPGDRDRTMNRVTGALVFAIYFRHANLAANELAEVFRLSLTRWANEPGATKTIDEEMTKVTLKIARHLEEAAEKAEEKKREHAEYMKGMRERAFKREPNEGLPPVVDVGIDGPQDDTPPTETESVDLRFHILIRHNSYYLWNGLNYLGPYNRENELLPAMRDAFAKVPVIEWVYINDEGVTKKKDLHRLLHDYATTLADLVYDSTIKKTYYDEKANTLNVACAPMRDIEPKFHADIDKWLRLLGGKHADKLLDWIASLNRLDRQSCAPYISGIPGTGKTLLSNGLSRLWKARGGPTNLAHVVGSFSADLLRCPLVVADEQLPPNISTGTLRELIGSSSFMVTQKFLSNASLNGSIRVLLLANNDKMLQCRGEDMTSDDIRALADRFLFIPAGAESRDHVQEIDTDGWVDRDMIAAHARWLMKNRVVKAGKRFLVEGEESTMHRKLVMRLSTPGAVLEWLTRFVSATPAMITQEKGAVVGDGSVWVTAEAITGGWEQYVGSKRVPPTHVVVEALKAMSERKESRVRDEGDQEQKRQDYWQIRNTYLLDYADEAGVGLLVDKRIHGPEITKKGPLKVIEGGKSEKLKDQHTESR